MNEANIHLSYSDVFILIGALIQSDHIAKFPMDADYINDLIAKLERTGKTIYEAEKVGA